MPYNVLKRPGDFKPAWIDCVEIAARHPEKWFTISFKQREAEILPELRRLRLLRDSFKVFPLAFPFMTAALKGGNLHFRRGESTLRGVPIEVSYRTTLFTDEDLKNILEEHRKRG